MQSLLAASRAIVSRGTSSAGAASSRAWSSRTWSSRTWSSRTWSSRTWRPAKFVTVALLASSLAGCLGYDGEIHHGFQADAQAVADVKPGVSAEQVLVLLGTPSTTSTVGGDAWYYISQTTNKTLAFMPARLTDQHIYAVYFDKAKKVTRIANYGMEDGKVVDFSNRSTVTGGAEGAFVKSIMLNLMHFGSPS